MKLNKTTLYIIIAGLLLLVIYQFINPKTIETTKEIVTIDTITVEKHFRDSVPYPVKEYITKIITDTFFIYSVDTITNEVIVDIPITSKEYVNTTDSISYKANISGYKANLDSINIWTNYEYYNTTITKQPNKQLKDRFNIAPSAGVGYGILNNKFDIYFGVSLTFDLF